MAHECEHKYTAEYVVQREEFAYSIVKEDMIGAGLLICQECGVKLNTINSYLRSTFIHHYLYFLVKPTCAPYKDPLRYETPIFSLFKFKWE